MNNYYLQEENQILKKELKSHKDVLCILQDATKSQKHCEHWLQAVENQIKSLRQNIESIDNAMDKTENDRRYDSLAMTRHRYISELDPLLQAQTVLEGLAERYKLKGKCTISGDTEKVCEQQTEAPKIDEN